MNLLMRVAAIAMMLHITPAVVLVKRPDAVEALLPGADAYTARDVRRRAARRALPTRRTAAAGCGAGGAGRAGGRDDGAPAAASRRARAAAGSPPAATSSSRAGSAETARATPLSTSPARSSSCG